MNNATTKRWSLEEDKLVLKFYLKYKNKCFSNTAELDKILRENGYTRTPSAIMMRLGNFEYVVTGGDKGLSNIPPKIQRLYDDYKNGKVKL